MENSVEMETRQKHPPLVLAWLGTPVSSYADRPLTFRTRKALALLIYLSVEVGTHTREKLVTLFWPESDTARGRGMLRTSLAHLREALDTPVDSSIATSHLATPHLATSHLATAYLKVETQTLSFSFDSHFELDLHRIQAGLDVIQRQPTLAERGDSIRQLQRAVSGYRGDFLEGFSLADAPAFDDWVSLQREIWHSRMNQIFDVLSQWQFEAGDLPAALETATRWKAHDLYAEHAPQRLMQLHFANSNRAAALEVYDEYAKMLAAEFGGKPAAAIKALAARIRARSPVQPARQQTPLTLTPADLSFVGRVEEFTRLKAAYHAASCGQTQVVVLIGEAGIGKTRLTTEFLQWASAQGADLLTGRAFETGGEVPYQPLAQLLRHRLEQENAPDDLLSTTWLAELSRLLPELRDRYPDLPQPQPNEATAQSSLLESITRLGEALAERDPLLLFIDDIQWADMSSLDALHYAMLRWTEHKAPVLLLLCTRESSSTEKSNLRQWLASLKAKLVFTQLALAPLTVGDTLALLSSLEAGQSEVSHPTQEAAGQQGAGQEGEELLSSTSSSAAPKFKAFAQALFAETGGQPLYLIETIKTLLEQKMLIPYHTEEGSQGLRWRTLVGETIGHFPLPRIIPNSVREAILDRLARLTPAAISILTAAAVLGQAATFRQLSEMSGLDQMEALYALEELVAKRLLFDSNDGSQGYMIAHDKIRDVIYAESSATRRQVFHSRAVTAIQGGGNAMGAARLAYHALAAGMDAEAFHYSVVAGDAALQLFAASEASAHYETARTLVATGQVPQADLDKLRHLYSSLGRALELNSQFELAGTIYEELKSIAQQRADPALTLVALTAQVTLQSMLSHSFNPDQGEAIAQEALRLARQLSNPIAEAKILWALMNFRINANRFPEALAVGEQALVLARELNLREQMAFILNDQAKCYLLSGRLGLAEQPQREASELWRELHNLPMLADSLAGSASIARWTGDYDLVLTLSAEAYNISHSIANMWGQAYSQTTPGYVYWERGEPARAIAVMSEAIRLAEKANYLVPQIFARAELGALYASLGETQQGFELMHLALDIANTRLPMMRIYVIGLLARLHVAHNHLAEAETFIVQSKQEADHQNFSFRTQWVFLAEAELALMQGNFAHTLALTDAILKAIEQAKMRSVTSPVLYIRGRCFARMEQHEAARATLWEAHAEAEFIGSRRMVMQIMRMLADIETDPIQAEHLHQQAQTLREEFASRCPPELRATFLS
ncbi:MAG: AAA family ATPase [Litorilinea sp.]